MEKEMKFIIKNPVDIADVVYKAAAAELDEIIVENEKRTQRFQKPLRVPKLNVKQMLENIDSLTEMTFNKPTNLYPWDNQSSKKAWSEIAKIKLRDDYLLKLTNDDDDLLQQLSEVWPELTPEPTLTKEQLSELSKLQQQADDIIKQAIALETEFNKLAEQEKDIIRNTQSKYDERIADQVKYLHVNLQYFKDHVKKW
ncbi:hypothetical protein SDC9_77665 [bioreactor metagenome]|uniref:Uncharacterized protein n=1 Tax=bioreactor metagenome TaxID=1076179 RepID=A0A644YR85_9ZZZZ